MVLTPIFRHRSPLLVPFQDTFDIAQFAKITQTAELKEFKRECGSMVKVVLMGPHTRQDLFSEMSRNYKKLKKKYLAKFGITLPSDATVPSTDEDARERLESSANETCVGVFISYSYVHQSTLLNGMGLPMNATADIATSVDRHLKRVPTITSVADAVKDSICEGKPYLALHWRNKTGEQCSSKRKTSLINPVNCRKFLSSLTKAGDKFASDVSDIMSIHNLSCIYVAYLPYSKEIIDMLSRRIEDISTAADILEAADTSSVSAVLTDEYMFSLVEQEICYRAEVFIGSMWSNWANFVASEFESEDRPVYYLLGVRGSLVEPVANITISRDSDGVPRP
ncbi:uncharacterized protein [Ptychodera flava]|uniref:uncharacterized protein n=1 Tax=Ptychodera flava TaxID=63121 RepID=UPI00396A9611